MSIYGINEKVCATCMFWRGERQTNVEFIQTLNYEGNCNCEDSFYGIKTKQGCSCIDWRKILENNNKINK
ncbi:hypothetical protein SAMN05428976_11225 [Clostridium sp. USBA 49]|jgi:hypothetical protein|uniref:hypothetical protein n=1 Tax=Clostridium TaxID=1485 RepID=UPI000999D6DB|nr:MULTISPECIES: hypothetical protein [Clostridium]SKA88805.1 hypothetical protein SAMN05428976_11225 [Clostridium sp. USBA 49]